MWQAVSQFKYKKKKQPLLLIPKSNNIPLIWICLPFSSIHFVQIDLIPVGLWLKKTVMEKEPLLSPPPSLQPLSSSLLRCLYIGHFLARWGARFLLFICYFRWIPLFVGLKSCFWFSLCSVWLFCFNVARIADDVFVYLFLWLDFGFGH